APPLSHPFPTRRFSDFAVVLERLRGRPLLMDVVAVALSEGSIHLPARNVHGVDGRVVQAPPMTRIFEHRERLAAVVDEDLPTLRSEEHTSELQSPDHLV